jgi:methylmalonyl-CoA mutase
MAAALRKGIPQNAIAATAVTREKGVRGRRTSIVGVNNYANPLEKPLDVPAWDKEKFYKRRVQQVTGHRTSFGEAENQEVLEKLSAIFGGNQPESFEACVEAVLAGATLGEITRILRVHDLPEQPIQPLALGRASAAFETLRKAMACFSAGLGKLPAVFLCNMGSLKEYKARADFSRGFFATAGFDAVNPGGFAAPETAVEAFLKSGSRVAVICSTDENYPKLVEPLCRGIRASKPDTLIVLAGYPQEHVETFKKTGVDEFIHIRADAVEVLTRVLKILGAPL